VRGEARIGQQFVDQLGAFIWGRVGEE